MGRPRKDAQPAAPEPEEEQQRESADPKHRDAGQLFVEEQQKAEGDAG